MNKTVLTIVQTDSGGNDAKFTVTGERNGLILFEEDFVYDGKVPPLKLHLEKEKFMKELSRKAKNGEMDDIDISTRCVLKMLLDLSDSKVDYLSNYGEKKRSVFTFDDYKSFCNKYLPNQTDDIIERDYKVIQSLPKGTVIRLPCIKDCSIGSFEIY